MLDRTTPRVTKWPFFGGDVLLLGAALFVYAQGKLPLGAPELSLAVGCIALAAVLGVLPFILEYRAIVRIADTAALSSVVAQVQQIEKVAEQISGATARWQNAQDAAEKTVNAAKAIGERMAAEVKAFTEFMQRVTEGERNTMRLEVDKLRRGEQEWLQVLVRMLDHVHALHAGAVRSGQPNLIEQLSLFQNACREAARRVGLVPVTAALADSFDPERHQVLEGDGKPAEGARIAEMVATGYTFQGKILRPVLVRLKSGEASSAVAPDSPSQLPLAGTE